MISRNIFWFAVRRQSHHFVLAAVDSETGVVSEGAVEQSQAVGKAQFFQQRDLVSLADADRAGGPLADAVDRQDRGFFERRRIERAGGMALVMIAEEQFPLKLLAELSSPRARSSSPPAFASSVRIKSGIQSFSFIQSGIAFRNELKSGRRVVEIGFEQTIKFQQRLVVEADVVELVGVQIRLRCRQ